MIVEIRNHKRVERLSIHRVIDRGLGKVIVKFESGLNRFMGREEIENLIIETYNSLLSEDIS